MSLCIENARSYSLPYKYNHFLAHNHHHLVETKKPLTVSSKGFLYKIRHRPTLPPVTAIPSALAGLTSLFGMGRGGHRRNRHLKYLCQTEHWKTNIPND